jgi:hypothetical protein
MYTVSMKISLLLLIVGLVSSSGCACSQEKSYPLVKVASEEMLRCDSNEDCVLSYLYPNSCCGALCEATARYNKTFALRLKQWHEQACKDEMCPEADCAESEFEYQAVCRAGMCETESIKLDGPSDEE